MSAVKLKVETGLQLLARLAKKDSVFKNFYNCLFVEGLKVEDVIEITGENNSGKSLLLADIIAEAVMPATMGGAETEVLVINTDGNMNTNVIFQLLKQKILKFTEQNPEFSSKTMDIFNSSCTYIHVMNIYDANQFHITVQSLESVLIENPNISFIMFDTLTSFYWAEQNAKLTKMDTYIKNILRSLKMSTKNYKYILIYTLPEYFNLNKERSESLEINRNSTRHQPNYWIQLIKKSNGQQSTHQVSFKTMKLEYNKYFVIHECSVIKWTKLL